ncbi:MAG: lactate utilization protein [Hyphomicrobiales bacterium]|nr:LUD domain-containing protein [Hyphomicrobiales bacterium]MDE2016161.1 lactate utilization protein [Hyphomicrobiales bacterium]
MSARDDVFASIRAGLGVRGDEAPRRAAVEARLRDAPRGVVPARGELDLDGRVALFKAEAERVAATVVEIADARDLPAELARYLRDNNLPATVRFGADPFFDGLPFGDTALEVSRGPSEGADAVGLSRAAGAVAETGTLALLSGADNPTTLNFLPETHVVAVARGDVAGDYETLIARVRAQFGRGDMPRTLNFVTGPSRSADIEQTLVQGAHGPKRLHVVIVGASA